MKSIHQLKDERARLVASRTDVTESLADLNAQKGNMFPKAYAEQRAALAATDARLNQQIVEVNRKIRDAHQAEHPTWSNGQTRQAALELEPPAVPVETKEEKRALIEDIRALRDYYEDLSSDRTRLPSIRVMGAEFTKELSTIIRRHIKPNQH